MSSFIRTLSLAASALAIVACSNAGVETPSKAPASQSDGTNGFTTNDMTQYFQAVPKDALEKIIWAEADKLGWFINTVSQEVVDKEKQVVKNEKRQRVDNQPYGHNLYIVAKAIYPEGHPYNWQVIGSLAGNSARARHPAI